MHVTCSYLQLRVVVLALLACHSVTCEYASAATCEYRFLQVSCHTLLALHLRQLHVALERRRRHGTRDDPVQLETELEGSGAAAPGPGTNKKTGTWRMLET